MAEISFPWDGDAGSGGVGDCGPYTGNEYDDLYRCLFTTDQHDSQGVLEGLNGELAVSGTSSPVNVAAGGAVVNGKFYRLDTATTVAVPSPVIATRIDRIILRADYSAQTVRVVRLAGTEGSGTPPTLTQSDGVTWEISLAQVSITTAGAITVTDERSFCHFATRVSESMLDTSVAGNGLSGGGGSALSVNVDGSTIEISSDTLRVKDSGITAAKISTGVAGNGLSGGGGSALSVNVDGSTIEISSDTLRVKDSGITAAKISTGVAGNGLSGGGGSALSVNVDNSTIEIGSDTLRVKDSGITNAKLAASAKRMKSEIIMWSGTLSGHYPVDPDTAAPNTNWHICNGDTENGVVTPDLRDRFVIAQGSTYTEGDTGGSSTKDLSHNHSNPNTNVTSNFTTCAVDLGGTDVATRAHVHTQNATGTSGSATQDIMPPYYCLIFLCYVGS